VCVCFGMLGSRKRRPARRGSRTAAGSGSAGSFEGNVGPLPASESR